MATGPARATETLRQAARARGSAREEEALRSGGATRSSATRPGLGFRRPEDLTFVFECTEVPEGSRNSALPKTATCERPTVGADNFDAFNTVILRNPHCRKSAVVPPLERADIDIFG